MHCPRRELCRSREDGAWVLFSFSVNLESLYGAGEVAHQIQVTRNLSKSGRTESECRLTNVHTPKASGNSAISEVWLRTASWCSAIDSHLKWCEQKSRVASQRVNQRQALSDGITTAPGSLCGAPASHPLCSCDFHRPFWKELIGSKQQLHMDTDC